MFLNPSPEEMRIWVGRTKSRLIWKTLNTQRILVRKTELNEVLFTFCIFSFLIDINTDVCIYICYGSKYYLDLIDYIICPDLGEQADKTANGFRTVSRPLVLQKTFRWHNILQCLWCTLLTLAANLLSELDLIEARCFFHGILVFLQCSLSGFRLLFSCCLPAEWWFSRKRLWPCGSCCGWRTSCFWVWAPVFCQPPLPCWCSALLMLMTHSLLGQQG